MNYYNQPEQPARIRLMHGVQGAQPVDVYINDRPVVRGLRYNQSTQYITLPSGQYNVKIYSSQNNELLLEQDLPISGSMFVTVEQRNDQLVLNVKEEQMPGMQMPYDGMMPEMPYGQQMPGMQMPHEGMMPEMPYGQQMPGMQNPHEGMMPEMPYGQQMPGMQNPHEGMMPDMQCGQQQMPGMPDMPCGQQQMPYGKPMPYGYQMQQQDQSIFDRPQYDYQMRDNEPKGSAKVRFAHFSPNAPEVDITLPNGTVLFRNVPYKAVTDFINVAPGTYNLEVRPTGSDVVVLTVPNVLIRPNDVKTIYAIGLVNGTPPLEAIIIPEMI